VFDQAARRAVQCIARRFAAQAGGEAASQLFAEFDTPLVEGIEIPQHAEAEHLVFVEGDQLAERERRQFGQDDGGRWLVAGEGAVGQQGFRDAGLAGFFLGLAESQGRRLGQAVGEQTAVVAGQRKVGFAEGDEVAGDQFAALVQQLEKGVLAVGAGRAPEDGSGGDVDRQALAVDVLAVAFHLQLLQVGG